MLGPVISTALSVADEHRSQSLWWPSAGTSAAGEKAERSVSYAESGSWF